jgi:hypothetical protein
MTVQCATAVQVLLLCCSAAALLLLCCCSAAALLLLCCCSAAALLLLHRKAANDGGKRAMKTAKRWG